MLRNSNLRPFTVVIHCEGGSLAKGGVTEGVEVAAWSEKRGAAVLAKAAVEAAMGTAAADARAEGTMAEEGGSAGDVAEEVRVMVGGRICCCGDVILVML